MIRLQAHVNFDLCLHFFFFFFFFFFFHLQEAIVKIMKMRKKITNAALQTELVEILKNMFLPSKKLIKEQIEWLIEHKYMRRDEDNINMFIYMAWFFSKSPNYLCCSFLNNHHLKYFPSNIYLLLIDTCLPVCLFRANGLILNPFYFGAGFSVPKNIRIY